MKKKKLTVSSHVRAIGLYSTRQRNNIKKMLNMTWSGSYKIRFQ